MNSVIEDLYYGNLRPCEQFKPTLRHFREKRGEAVQGYKSFINKLDAEKAKEFEVLIEKHLDAWWLEMEQNFSDGFRLGIKLMCEAFMHDDLERYLEALEQISKVGKTL